MSYHQQWEDYRRRRFLFWFVFLTYIPGIILTGALLTRLLHSDKVIGVVAIMWTVALAITAFYKGAWKCPRCHKLFFQKWEYYIPFANADECKHCGLPKWAESDEQNK